MESPQIKVVSIVIPAWNEEKTLEKVIHTIQDLNFGSLPKEIICIDDGSTDKTPQILTKISRRGSIKVITNKNNLGKSQSVKKGVLRSKGDIVLIQDADLETDPDDLIPMVKLITNGQCDVVFGNRYDKKVKNKVSILNYIGNKIITNFSNLFTFPRGLVVPDMEVCYKVMRGDIFRDIAKKLQSRTTIGIEPEITARIARYRIEKRKLRIKIYPIKYSPRTLKEGKKARYIVDGLKAIWEIIKFNTFVE